MNSSRVVISGSSGLIGRALTASLEADNVHVIHLVRRPPRHANEVQWLGPSDRLNPAVFEGAQAVVNLNGASIGRLPWTGRYRETLRDSRLLPTRTLATAIRSLGHEAPPFLSASAVGFYGHRPGEALTEQSDVGRTFLARLSADWEHEAHRAGPHARVTLLRTAPLLHPEGVLKPMVLLAKLGASGPLGSGTQIWPWISLEDEVRAIRHLIDHPLAGPVNLSGPTAASASDIGREIAGQLGRPYLLPAPAWALRLGLGRAAADSLLLADARVVPERLTQSGFTFTHSTAESAVAAALSR